MYMSSYASLSKAYQWWETNIVWGMHSSKAEWNSTLLILFPFSPADPDLQRIDKTFSFFLLFLNLYVSLQVLLTNLQHLFT